MSDLPESYVKIKAELRPYWEALVRAVYERGLFVTGFVYGDTDPAEPTGPLLVRFGNMWSESPEEMFYTHYQLALMAARLESMGGMTREIINAKPSDGSEGISGPKPQTPQEIADRLVLALLAVPTDALPDHIQEFLNQYAESRRPEKK